MGGLPDMGSTKSEGMRCSGRFLYARQEHECVKKWRCKNFSIRAKPKRETPKLKSMECDLYKPTMDTT